MRPTAHLPMLIGVVAVLVCLIAAPAAARTPSMAVSQSAALAATEKAPAQCESYWPLVLFKAPFQYESFWPHVLLRAPSLAIPHALIPATVAKRPSLPVFRPPQIVEPDRKRPSRPVFRPAQIEH
jgi:hypothetical protein